MKTMEEQATSRPEFVDNFVRMCFSSNVPLRKQRIDVVFFRKNCHHGGPSFSAKTSGIMSQLLETNREKNEKKKQTRNPESAVLSRIPNLCIFET